MNMDKKINKENLDLFLNNYNKISKVLLIKSPTINFKTINVKVHKESGYMTYPPIEITTLAATIRKKYLKILKENNKWSFFFDKLGVTNKSIKSRNFIFSDFKAGREMD